MSAIPFLTTLLILGMFLCQVQGKTYDLSHVHRPTTFVFDGVLPYNYTTVFQGEMWPDVYVSHGYYTTGEHSGTHMDAPSHFIPGGKDLGQVTVDMSIAEGVMVDCVEEARQNRSYSVPISKLQDWEKVHGRIPDNAAVLFNFGWSPKYGTQAFFGPLNGYDFPYVSAEAGLWLYNERAMKIIGVDTLSPDSMDAANGNLNVIHKKLLGDDKLIIENLNALHQLPARGFRFYAVPVKYEGSTGTQIRAFAMSTDQDTPCTGSIPVASLVVSLGMVLVSALL